MRSDDVEIHIGEPGRPYQVIGPIKAWVSGRAMWRPTPTVDVGNSRLREEAAKMGANAVINVTYDRAATGLGKGWHVLNMSGTAVVLAPNDKKCPSCAEVIRAEAARCRFCGYSFG